MKLKDDPEWHNPVYSADEVVPDELLGGEVQVTRQVSEAEVEAVMQTLPIVCA